ncbi:MAG: tRNA pseudouridine(55) synthase TruB [Zetaproteobacteria bacterium]|nr:tRNA pseudouridine(55) synthase TruB [Zetaproteobacteria bacterium]
MKKEGCSGVVFLDKPLGWSSRQAVNEMVRLYSPGMRKSERIKVGHAGTLDPLATGMLPILLGEATRFASLGLNAEKSYQVTFDLSMQSDTLDLEGEEVARFEHQPTVEDLQQVLKSMLGSQQQVPPIYSAIKIDGKRAHAMARCGETVQLDARDIEIYELLLNDYSYPMVSLRVRCSKGTYIRALARDIGEKLSCGGCVTELRRTSTGGWPEAVMLSLDEIKAAPNLAVVPIRQWLRDVVELPVDAEAAKRFLHGQRIQCDISVPVDSECEVQVYCGDVLLGLGLLKRGVRRMVLHPERILPSAQSHFHAVAKGCSNG